MPCDSVIVNRVEMSKMDPVLLQKALERMGCSSVVAQAGRVSFVLDGTRHTIAAGTLQTTARNAGAVADRVKRAYSAETVRYTAAKNGWKVQQTGPTTFKVMR